MSRAKALHPRHNAKTDSSVAATAIIPTSTNAAVAEPNPKYAIAAPTDSVAPMLSREPLRWAGDELRLERQLRREHSRDELSERRKRRAAEGPGDEPVRQHEREPGLIERDRHDAEDHHATGHEPPPIPR